MQGVEQMVYAGKEHGSDKGPSALWLWMVGVRWGRGMS